MSPLDPRVLRLLGLEVHDDLDGTPCPDCGAVEMEALVSGETIPVLAVVSDELAILARCGACGWEMEVDRPREEA